MEQRLVVSTECPTCGAPLDFQEGSNAVRCNYCRSNLLVTGRKQVLSYYVEPKVEPRDGARNAWLACHEKGWRCHALKWERYFVPYYRFFGHDLRWERKEPERSLHEDAEDGDLRLMRSTSDLEIAALLATAAPKAVATPSKERDDTTVFCDRYVDKNFLALDLQGTGIYSLGVRPAVLKLRLFRAETVRALGRIVAPTVTVEAALAQGLATAALEAGILQRRVIGRVLSVIYYPFCMIEIERQGETLLGMVDGVSGNVVQLDAAYSLYGLLQREPAGDAHCVGFRPLVCPNCGWDLPVNPEHIVFFCATCERAWEIVGSDLRQVEHQIADVPPPPDIPASAPVRFLPFWLLKDGRAGTQAARFHVPAFRYRRLKLLVDLTRDISGRGHQYAVHQGKAPSLHGCYYDQEDAANIAEITHPGLTPFAEETIKQLSQDPLSLVGASLAWFPFHGYAQSLREPFTGHTISEQLLF
jgi:LSD1 subclass zinc finger protein